MDEPRTGTLHHVEIYVSDLNRSLEFWGWLLGELGYQQYQDWPQGRSYKLNHTYLVFVQTESDYQDIPYHRKRTGLNHLAFWVDDESRFKMLSDEIRLRGIEILYPLNSEGEPAAIAMLDETGYRAIFFEDPDRIKVELVLK